MTPLIFLLILLSGLTAAEPATATWTAPTQDVNGQPIQEPVEHRVYYGLGSRHYTTILDVGEATSAIITGLEEGVTYYFAVTARTASGGESAFSTEVAFRVPGTSPPDTEPPIVRITRPTDGSTVPRRSTLTITARAMDNIGVREVELYVNDVLRCTDSVRPYTCAWKIPRWRWRQYTLEAVATDVAGNVGASAPVVVTTQ